MDTYQNTVSFIRFPSLDATASTPSLTSTHCQLAVLVVVWHNSPSVASTGLIFIQSENEKFVTTVSRRDSHRPTRFLNVCCCADTLRHLRNSRKNLLKFNFPVRTIIRHQNCIFRRATFFVQRKITTGVSHRNHHLLYMCHIEQLIIGYVRSTQILYMSSLVRHSSLLVQNLQQKV